jgi:hypothetical protein
MTGTGLLLAAAMAETLPIDPQITSWIGRIRSRPFDQTRVSALDASC